MKIILVNTTISSAAFLNGIILILRKSLKDMTMR